MEIRKYPNQTVTYTSIKLVMGAFTHAHQLRILTTPSDKKRYSF